MKMKPSPRQQNQWLRLLIAAIVVSLVFPASTEAFSNSQIERYQFELAKPGAPEEYPIGSFIGVELHGGKIGRIVGNQAINLPTQYVVTGIEVKGRTIYRGGSKYSEVQTSGGVEGEVKYESAKGKWDVDYNGTKVTLISEDSLVLSFEATATRSIKTSFDLTVPTRAKIKTITPMTYSGLGSAVGLAIIKNQHVVTRLYIILNTSGLSVETKRELSLVYGGGIKDIGESETTFKRNERLKKDSTEVGFEFKGDPKLVQLLKTMFNREKEFGTLKLNEVLAKVGDITIEMSKAVDEGNVIWLVDGVTLLSPIMANNFPLDGGHLPINFNKAAEVYHRSLQFQLQLQRLENLIQAVKDRGIRPFEDPIFTDILSRLRSIKTELQNQQKGVVEFDLASDHAIFDGHYKSAKETLDNADQICQEVYLRPFLYEITAEPTLSQIIDYDDRFRLVGRQQPKSEATIVLKKDDTSSRGVILADFTINTKLNSVYGQKINRVIQVTDPDLTKFVNELPQTILMVLEIDLYPLPLALPGRLLGANPTREERKFEAESKEAFVHISDEMKQTWITLWNNKMVKKDRVAEFSAVSSGGKFSTKIDIERVDSTQKVNFFKYRYEIEYEFLTPVSLQSTVGEMLRYIDDAVKYEKAISPKIGAM